MYKILRGMMTTVGQEAIDFTKDLVQTQSVSLDESRVGDLVEEMMKRLGYYKVFRDDFGNVLGLLSSVRESPTVLLSSHMDTVPPSGDSSEQQSCEMDEARLYGLGSADCKGGLSAQVFAGALLKRSLLPLRGNLIVAATTAEKNGLSVGLRGLLSATLPELGLKPDFAILGEPTDLGVYYGHDGWMEMDVNIRGLNPFGAEDAVGSILDSIRADGLSGRTNREMLRVSAPDYSRIAAESAVSFRVSKRINEQDDAGTALAEVKEHVVRAAEASGSRVAVGVAVRGEEQRLCTGKVDMVRYVTRAWCTDPFHPMIDRTRQSLEAAGCRVNPGKWRLGRLGMGTGGSVLLNEFGIPTIGYGPGLETQAHATGEYVELEKIGMASYGSAVIAHGIVGIPVCGWSSDEI